MPTTEISARTLDTILAYQFTIAWAGEGLCEPARLGWWRTDLVDEYGGGDLIGRIAPRTQKWAALEAVRHAAALADLQARKRMADSDRVRTLFFWGFELDERVSERLRDHKGRPRQPEQALPLPLPLTAEFDRQRFEEVLRTEGVEAGYTVQLSGRELKEAQPDDPAQAARMLLAAMLPLGEEYPAPFFRV